VIGAPSVCHIFPTFAPGGPELKRTEIVNALGQRFRHTIMAIDGNYEAAARVERSAPVEFVPAPPWEGRPDYALAMRALLRQMAPDLVVTHAWGAIYALIGAYLARVCPVVHAENGFGPDEAVSFKWRRRLVRRLMLRTTYAVLVPSRTLERVALAEFGVPRTKLIRVPNGVNLRKFHPRRDLT
jgi:glycosyltransferase involved in cell wall biosynthesis